MSTSYRKTRSSLAYVVGYLTVGGLLFLLLPDKALRIFQSSGNYDDIMIRAVGLMMLGLDIVVIQIIRLNLIKELYPTTLIIRIFLSGGLLVLYFYSSDLMFLIIAGIVFLGILMTIFFYLQERK